MNSAQRTRGPWIVLAVIGLITALCAVGLTRLRIANDPQEFLPDHPTVQLFREVERDFGVASFAHVIAVRFAPRENFSIESPQAILEMEAVLQALRAVPGIVSAQGIPDFVKFVRAELHGGDRRFYSLPADGDELGYSFAEIIRMAFQRMALLKKFTSLAGTALATATIAKDADIIAVSRQALAALKPIQERAVALEIGLVSYGETLDVFNRVTQRDIRYLTPLVFALIALTLLWVFRLTRPWELGLVFVLIAGVALGAFSPELFPRVAVPVDLALAGALALLVLLTYKPLASLYLTLGVVGVSGVWAFGLLGWLGIPVNFLMAAVFPLLMGIGDDYAIHLLHRYEEERCKKQPGPQAIWIALTRTGRAITLTTVTTAVGFTALFFAPSPPIRWFGLLAAVSVISALIITVTLIPALKQIFTEGPRTEQWPGTRRIFAHPQASLLSLWLGRYAERLRGRAAMTAVLLLGVLMGAFGYWEGRAFQTYTVDYRRLLPPDYPTVVLYTQVNQEFRTYDEVQLVLTGEIARLDVMRVLLKDIPEALAASPYAHTVTSIAHYLEDVRAANPQLAQGFMDRFLNDPDEAYRWLLGEVLAKDSLRQRAEAYVLPIRASEKTVVRVNTMRFSDQEGVRRVARDISERFAPVIAKLNALGIEALVTGVPFVEELGLNALHQSLTRSLAISFGLCFLVMALALRSVLWGVIGLFPMVLVTGVLLGTVSLLRLELNAATAIVAAISIGLGVDYAIHLMHRFREERDLARATARTGEALFAAFFTTASAFFVLTLSTITWNRDFGLLVGLAVFYAFVVTVFVFPALLALATRLQKESHT
ncbi:MAG: MMPL family transporter [Candidatus Bipolaricaulota bacterium]|nr:MMPL family transporter [Candidatus Bipolaricaulota bacterium]